MTFDFSTLPESKRNLRNIQLGAGTDPTEEWINIDMVEHPYVDIVHDLRQGLPFNDSEINAFYSHHVIEHFTKPEALALFREVYRCLANDGVFISRLPDLLAVAKHLIAERHMENMLTAIYGWYGVGATTEPSHLHKYGWTCVAIRAALENAGFSIEKCEAVGSDSPIPVIDFVVRKSVPASILGERVIEVPWLFSMLASGSVLDIGCAESDYTTELLKRQVSALTMVDIRDFPDMDDERVTKVLADIRELSVEELGQFDNVLCVSTLEHIALEAYGLEADYGTNSTPFEAQKEAFQHIMSFVKKGGQCLLTLPYSKTYENGGWYLVYDADMLAALTENYDTKTTFFTLTDRENNVYQPCAQSECPDETVDLHLYGVRAVSCACLSLKHKEE